MTRVERINSAVDSVVEVVEHTAASLAIPVADGVVSWLAAENMVRTLGFSWPVSIMTGVALEGCGIVVSRAALRVRRYNQTRGAKPPALEWLAWTLLGAQFAVGAVLVTVNTVATSSMLFGLLTLATLSAVGTLAHMLENDVAETSHSADVLPSSERVAEVIAEIAPATAKDRVMWAYRENPHADKREVAQALGIGYSTVSKAYRELLAAGAIEHNGEDGR
ncbi:MAG: hypothetical protein WC683_19920 [bacterium]